MNRIRFAMAPALDTPKLQNTVELDEVYVGPRKPRYKGVSGPGHSTLKTPVFCAVEGGGQSSSQLFWLSGFHRLVSAESECSRDVFQHWN